MSSHSSAAVAAETEATKYSAVALVGRVGSSAIFLFSGIGKLAAPSATVGFIASVGLPLPRAGYAVAVAIELLGGLALLIGFRVRWTAAILAVFCIATALSFHAHFADQNQLFHFLKNIAMAGGMLQIVAFGAGCYSLDARRQK